MLLHRLRRTCCDLHQQVPIWQTHARYEIVFAMHLWTLPSCKSALEMHSTHPALTACSASAVQLVSDGVPLPPVLKYRFCDGWEQHYHLWSALAHWHLQGEVAECPGPMVAGVCAQMTSQQQCAATI